MVSRLVVIATLLASACVRSATTYECASADQCMHDGVQGRCDISANSVGVLGQSADGTAVFGDSTNFAETLTNTFATAGFASTDIPVVTGNNTLAPPAGATRLIIVGRISV